MYRNISLEEGNYVLSEIEKQLNKENIELDLEIVITGRTPLSA